MQNFHDLAPSTEYFISKLWYIMITTIILLHTKQPSDLFPTFADSITHRSQSRE